MEIRALDSRKYAKIFTDSLVESGWRETLFVDLGPEFQDQLAMCMMDVLDAIADDMGEVPYLTRAERRWLQPTEAGARAGEGES